MGIFKEPAKAPNRDAQLKVLLTPGEKEELMATARRYGLTTSDLIREAVNEYVERREKRPKKK